MKSYEGLFIFPPESTPDVRKNQLKNLDDLFAKCKAQVTVKSEGIKKTLGYPIQKFQEGFTLVYDFQMDPAHATEFRRGLELQEELIKFMVTVKPAIKAEKKPAAPKEAAAPSSPSSHATHSAPHRPSKPTTAQQQPTGA
jgi:small subunit ribosomal protein S6